MFTPEAARTSWATTLIISAMFSSSWTAPTSGTIISARGEPDEGDLRLLKAVRRLHEQNPMLGLRGVRLGLMIPGLFAMQTRAVLEAAVLRVQAGGNPRAEIMVPLVGAVQELETIAQMIKVVAEEVHAASGVNIAHLVGTMIELPRAALTAGAIAESAEFFLSLIHI